MAYQYDGTVVPDGWTGSTNLNNSVTSYTDLTTRIKMQLGFPILSPELCDKMIYDNINLAIQLFSKYAGFTEEYLVFDSSKYVNGVGIQMDDVIASIGTFYNTPFKENEVGTDPTMAVDEDEDSDTYNPIDTNAPSIENAMWDYDQADYRKVVSCFSFDPFGGGNIDSLFDVDYIVGSQVMYSALMGGGGGYDLVTWHNLKEWGELRSKLFASSPKYIFDQRRQSLRLIPEPTRQRRYYGIIGCYLEKSIRDMLPEYWVFEYALALTKMTMGQIRGKFGSVNLVGGGSINWNDVMSQGIAERDRLKGEIVDAGDAPPLGFFVG